MTQTLEMLLCGFYCILSIYANYRLLSNKLTYRFHPKTIFPMYLLASILMFASGTVSDFLPGVPLKLPLMFSLYLLYFCMYKGTILIRLFWVVMTFLITVISELSIHPILLICTPIPFNELLNYPIVTAVAQLLAGILQLLLVELILAFGKRQNTILSDLFKEIVWILFIDAAYALIVSSLFYYENIYLDVDTGISLSMIVMCLVSFLSIILLYKVIKKSRDVMDTNLKLQQAEMNLQLNQDMTLVVENLRALRHDMNNHMSVLQGLVSMKEYDEVSSYLNSISEELNMANNFLFIDNKVLSVLINSKMTKAMNMGINPDIEILSGDTPLSDRDLCSLVGNILENAIEAASGHSEPYIYFSMKKTPDAYHIICDNNYTVQPITNGNNFISTKENTGYHGVGTKNIRSIVKDYKGTVDFTVDEQFHVHVTLPA